MSTAKSQGNWDSTSVLVLKHVVIPSTLTLSHFGDILGRSIFEPEVHFGGAAERAKGLLLNSEILITQLKIAKVGYGPSSLV